MHYLLIGGPAHGQERQVDNGENELIVMAPSRDNPIPTPFKYVRRNIQALVRPGEVFQRTLFVEQSVDPSVATQALAAILLQSFAEELVRQYMEGGELIGSQEESIPSESGSESVPGSSGRERSTPSGIVIASR